MPLPVAVPEAVKSTVTVLPEAVDSVAVKVATALASAMDALSTDSVTVGESSLSVIVRVCVVLLPKDEEAGLDNVTTNVSSSSSKESLAIVGERVTDVFPAVMVAVPLANV